LDIFRQLRSAFQLALFISVFGYLFEPFDFFLVLLGAFTQL